MKVSIITPILKVDKNLLSLDMSIYNNKKQLFNWILIGSKKIKNKKLNKLTSKRKTYFIEQENRGIYAALNKAILSNLIHDYYIILGQDDKIINQNLFNEINQLLHDDKINDIKADIYELQTTSANKHKINVISKIKQNFSPIFSHHSGGMLIKTSLHKKYGYYDEKYSLSSDYKFLKKIKKKIFIKKTEILSAKIGTNGSSANKPLKGLFERLTIDIEYSSRLMKICILLKYFYKIFKQVIFNQKIK